MKLTCCCYSFLHVCQAFSGWYRNIINDVILCIDMLPYGQQDRPRPERQADRQIWYWHPPVLHFPLFTRPAPWTCSGGELHVHSKYQHFMLQCLEWSFWSNKVLRWASRQKNQCYLWVIKKYQKIKQISQATPITSCNSLWVWVHVCVCMRACMPACVCEIMQNVILEIPTVAETTTYLWLLLHVLICLSMDRFCHWWVVEIKIGANSKDGCGLTYEYLTNFYV